ncbi:hypothetical protein [Ralstonia soli]|uniref:Transposase n=1 Tax=Ralstonia soli TaxID=2953896 RepID=A0ABT1APU5_9RALS|nr:hypothetical protein [Ralstonia soli]MCO5400331.1 hypothetical protein [Ralstonia soli]
MKMSKFTEAQIAFALKQAELGTKVEHNANGKEVHGSNAALQQQPSSTFPPPSISFGYTTPGEAFRIAVAACIPN